MSEQTRPLFRVGQVVATPGALEALSRSGESPLTFITRHLQQDRGELSADDHRANRRALSDGSRIFSAFKTSAGEKLWVITEGTDDDGVRQSTCILTPDEY